MRTELGTAVRRVEDACSKLGPAPRWDWPLIAVIGGRGVGKSAVLQALAGEDVLPPGVVLVEMPALEAARDSVVARLRDADCLILAVSPAYVDPLCSDALVAARAADPAGARTLGVVTKLDLVPDASRYLDNRVVHLRRGFVGVVCRGEDAERRFLLAHETYRRMAGRVGTPHLRRLVGRELASRVRDRLPRLEDALRGRLQLLDADVQEYRRDAGDGLLFRLVRRLRETFQGELEGSQGAEGRLSCGARIAAIFHERLPLEVAGAVFGAGVEELREEAAVAVRNARGVRAGVFAPDRALEAVARSRLRGLREPLLWCVEAVASELLRAAYFSTEAAVDGFPALRQEAEAAIAAEVRRREAASREEVLRYVARELSYTNTRHEDFVVRGRRRVVRRGAVRGGWCVLTAEALTCYKGADERELRYALPLEGLALRGETRGAALSLRRPDGGQVLRDRASLELVCADKDDADAWREALGAVGVSVEGGASPAEDLDRHSTLVAELAEAYVGVVAKTARDQTPKIVVHGLVDAVRGFVDADLLAALCACDRVDALTQESADRVRRREEALRLRDALRAALDALADLAAVTQSLAAAAPSPERPASP